MSSIITADFPAARPRRNRRDDFSRRLVQENTVSVNDFIYPVFVQEGQNSLQPVPSMPGVVRYSPDTILPVAEECVRLGIPVLSLFPSIDASLKTPDGIEACNPDGLIPRVIRSIKQEFPELGVLCDVALDPYTSHGQDGVIDENGYVLNEPTVEILRQQALVQAEAGADYVAPSDMMDGRIAAIRTGLEEGGFTDVGILSYAAKYASSFYGPFRNALDSAPKENAEIPNDKKTYQMDFHNSREALDEVLKDVAEGADIIMIKPGMPYLDIVAKVREAIDLPIAVYNVSGEYAMLKAAAQNGWLDNDKAIIESLTCIKRAGADMIFTYAAKEAAILLNQ